MVIIPMCILGILAIIFEEEVDDTLNETAIEIIICPLPNYDTGYNATEITCAVVDHPTPYSEENSFGFPTGWFTWIAHTLVTIFAKYGAIQLLVIGILGLNVILIIIAEAPILLIPYVMLYIVLGIGLYKTLSPFVGR